jgi:hypothetical protein
MAIGGSGGGVKDSPPSEMAADLEAADGLGVEANVIAHGSGAGDGAADGDGVDLRGMDREE